MHEPLRRCRVIKDYQTSNGDPFSVQAHEPFHVSEKVDFWNNNPEWVWIWCTDQRQKGGWVPKKRMQLDENAKLATLPSAYSALELTVVVGDELAVEEEESGWLWCIDQEEKHGWVPLEHVKYMQ